MQFPSNYGFMGAVGTGKVSGTGAKDASRWVLMPLLPKQKMNYLTVLGEQFCKDQAWSCGVGWGEGPGPEIRSTWPCSINARALCKAEQQYQIGDVSASYLEREPAFELVIPIHAHTHTHTHQRIVVRATAMPCLAAINGKKNLMH